MDATRYGNALDFDVQLHSIYAAYLGQFESGGIEWWDRSWGGYFGTFNDFLGFGWEVMVVVDADTGRAHIAVRREQIALFAKMIRTRFGESLAKDPPTTLPLSPVPTRNLSLRRLITLADLAGYRKLAQTLPAAELSFIRQRARAGDVGVAEQLFYAGGAASERDRGSVGVRDNGAGYTWACVQTTWWEKGGAPGGLVPGSGRTQGGGKGKGLVLEVGLAVVRCAHLRAVDVWPPTPGENYRKSHFIVEEWVDKRANQAPPSYPRAYAFGKSQWIADKNVERILDANLSALASQENDSSANSLILLSIGEPGPLPVPASSTLPTNILHVDVLALEFNLLRRAQEAGIPGAPDRQTPLPNLASLLQTLQIPVPAFAPLGNAGNEAYYTLLAFQKLVMAETRLPDLLFKQPEYQYSMYGFQPNSMVFNPLPPQAPFAQPHSRRNSNSRDMPPPPVPIESPRAFDARRASESSRPRPTSVSDPTALPGSPGSAPSTMRQNPRPPMPRSSTVFWDDAEYANADSSSIGRQEASLRDQQRLRPTQTSESSPSKLRERSQPPSAMRSGGHGSRTVSWSGAEADVLDSERGRSHPPVSASASYANGIQHAHGNGNGNGNGTDSYHSSPSPRRGRQSMLPPSASFVSSRSHASPGPASGSSVRLDSYSSSEGRAGAGEPARNGTAKSGLSRNVEDDNKGKKGKMKSEKSMKNVAGALARFWVG